MTRNLLDKRMKLLRSELAEMGSLVEKQIYNSIEAFKNKDMNLVFKVTENDDKVDELNGISCCFGFKENICNF